MFRLVNGLQSLRVIQFNHQMNGGKNHEHEFLQELRSFEESARLYAGDHRGEMRGFPPSHCEMGSWSFP